MRTFLVFLAVLLTAGLALAGNGDLIVNGNLGVGTTGPSMKMDMAFPANSDNGLKMTGSDNHLIRINSSFGGGYYNPIVQTGDQGIIFSGGGYNSGGGLVIAPWAANASGMRMDGNGNITFGAGATPSTRLDVRSSANGADGLNLQGSDNHWARMMPSMLGGWCNPIAQTGDSGIIFSNSFGTPGGGAFVIGPWSASGSPGIRIGGNGNIGIGTADLGSGGGSALLLASGSHPTSISDGVCLYSKDGRLHIFDPLGDDTVVSPHADDAPDALYDMDDGVPMVVKEVQYFLGYVRYTNHTRQARLAGWTDAEKQQLSPAQRTCVFKESFAEHETRTGEKLSQLIWEEEQARIKERKDAERQAIIDSRAQLSAALAAKNREMTAATGSQALQQDSTDMKTRLESIRVPPEYVMQPIPPRLQAALNRQAN